MDEEQNEETNLKSLLIENKELSEKLKKGVDGLWGIQLLTMVIGLLVLVAILVLLGWI